MESGYLAILSSKGQLTLPKPLRKVLKMQEGQRLLLEESRGGILVKKVDIHKVDDGLEQAEWEELQRLASRKGKVYKSGKAFLRSLKHK